MKTIVMCYFLLSCVSIKASNWEYLRGTKHSVQSFLRQYTGKSILYNCDLYIDKISNENGYTFWLTVIDRTNLNSVALSFLYTDTSKVDEVSELLVRKFSSLDRFRKSNSLKIVLNDNKELEYLEYRSSRISPFKVLNIVKCTND